MFIPEHSPPPKSATDSQILLIFADLFCPAGAMILSIIFFLKMFGLSEAVEQTFYHVQGAGLSIRKLLFRQSHSIIKS